MPTIRVRVVCGLFETMASFSARSRLSRVDLPALGRPTSATAPERSALERGARESAPGSANLPALLLLEQPLHAHPPRAPVVGALDHEAQPLHLDGLPHARHVPEEAEGQSAHGLPLTRL